MVRIAYSVFKSPRLAHEAHHLARRAREVLMTNSIVSIRPLTKDSFRVVAVSTTKGYWKVGGVSLAVRRGDYESIHYAIVSSRGFRCTCSYSIRMSTRADAALETLGLPPIASRYALCKHVIAALVKLYASGDLRGEKKALRNSLAKGLAVLYLALEDRETILRSAEVVKRVLEANP